METSMIGRPPAILRSHRRCTVMALLFALVTVAFAAQSAPAFASGGVGPSCVADSCTGRDPLVMGCEADAFTIDAVGGGPGTPYVELRFSNRCFAAWAQVTNCTSCWPRTTSAQGATCPSDSCLAVTEGGRGTYGNQPTSSPMVSYAYYVRACSQGALPPLGPPPLCTGWN